MYRDVKKWIAVKQSKVCNAMQDTYIPHLYEQPFDTIGIDPLGPFPITKRGNLYVLTVVDDLHIGPN